MALNDFGPADNGVAVTPSDSATLNFVRGIWVGGAGNVAVQMRGGADLTFVGVQAGTLLPIRVSKVKSTNTTATNIIALI